MPKRLNANWIVRGVAGSLATLGIAVGWQASSGVDRTLGNPRVLEQSDFGWRQGELLFLKAALNRLDADAKQTDLDSPALRSLRAEQDAVMLRMREVAWPVPAESLPRELHFLVNDEPRAAEEPPTVPNITTGVATAPAELKVGLASTSPAADLALSRDPELNFVILILPLAPPLSRQRTTSPSSHPLTTSGAPSSGISENCVYIDPPSLRVLRFSRPLSSRRRRAGRTASNTASPT